MPVRKNSRRYRFGIWFCARSVTILAGVPLVLPGWAVVPAQRPPAEAYYGNYRLSPQHLVGIDKFITDSGESAMLYSDYESGVVRRLFPISNTEFVMGPSFDVRTPAELDIRFIKDQHGTVTGISMRSSKGGSTKAARVPVREENVGINSGHVTLAGTLLMPATEGPHPAIILLHGSGPLTRYSFGPYPHFFTSLGFAVLIYDKRGTGASTGTLLDASTGTLMTRSSYPDDLVSDALAALHYLQGRDDINRRMIGFWGSSEGGMLTTQVAARSEDVAFIIDSSGFMGPLWRTISYQAREFLRSQGSSKADVERATEFTDMWLRVARTGRGWDEFVMRREEIRAEGKPWFFQSSGEFKSLDEMRWDWDHILAFDPLPAVKEVTCPVLAVYGAADTSTQVSVAARSIREALTQAGNTNFTINVFPNAGHSLMEMPSQNRMAPGVFETIRSWLVNNLTSPGTHAAR